MTLNKSCARTIDILELLADSPGPLTLSQICQHLSLPKSSTFEIMATLTEKEVVVYADEQLKSFQLGMKMFRIGSKVVSQTDLYSVARRALVQLGKTIGETVYLAVENHGKITYLDKVESEQPIRATCDIGSSNYMHLTGLGKALLAAYSPSKVEKIVGSGDLVTYTPQSIGSVQQLREELERIRQRGYSIDDRESMEFVRCIAVPIRNHTGHAVAAISAAVIYTRMTEAYIQQLSIPVVEAALEISHRLGYTKDTLY